MTSCLLVCQLVLLLSLGMASSDLPEHTGSIEGMETAETEVGMQDEISALGDISDGHLTEDEDDEFDENEGEKLAEDPLAATNIPPSRIRRIQFEARRIFYTFCKWIHFRHFRPFSRKRERQTALRKYYQAFVHGGKSFISDADLLIAKKSEKCSACLLNELCKRRHIHWLLNINGRLPV